MKFFATKTNKLTDYTIIKKEKLEECKNLISISLESFFLSIELEKYFSENNLRSLCGRYLVKKSILDHFKTNNFLEIQILNNEKGKPDINILGELKQKAKLLGISNLQCSISHSKNWVASMVVIEIN